MTVTIQNKSGRPRVDPFAIEQRRVTYRRLKARLNMTADEIAALTGLSVGTVRGYPGNPSRPNFAPTHATLTRMRQELLRRARAAVAEAEARYALEMDLAAAERRLGIGHPESEGAFSIARYAVRYSTRTAGEEAA